MEKIKRYIQYSHRMIEHEIGKYVKFTDYESLTEERDRLKEELEKVKNTASDLKKDVTVMPVTGIRWKESEGKNG